jgi:hypothetical protein
MCVALKGGGSGSDHVCVAINVHSLGIPNHLLGEESRTMKRTVVSAVLVLALLLVSISATWAAPEGRIGTNVALNTEVTNQIL